MVHDTSIYSFLKAKLEKLKVSSGYQTGLNYDSLNIYVELIGQPIFEYIYSTIHGNVIS